MSVQEPGQIPASLGSRRLTLDPVAEHTLAITLREVESSIPAGFQVEWGTVDVDGDELWLGTGAGFGSGWATFRFRDKSYVISASDLVEQFLKAVKT